MQNKFLRKPHSKSAILSQHIKDCSYSWLFTVGFPKELNGCNFVRFDVLSVFKLLPFQRYWELEGAVQTQYGRSQARPLSRQGPPRVALSRHTRGADRVW